MESRSAGPPELTAKSETTPENQILRFALPKIAPVWLLSILTGVLFVITPFFGATVGLLLVFSVYRSTRALQSASGIAVKNFESYALAALIPLLAVAAVLSSLHFPIAATTINLLMLSAVMPHTVLLYRTIEKLHHRFSFYASAVIFLQSCMLIPLVSKWGFEAVLPTVTVIIFAFILMCRSRFLLRDTRSTQNDKSSCLFMIFFYTLIWFCSSFEDPRRNPMLVAAAIAFALAYLYFDFLEHQMRRPYAEWNRESHWLSFYHVAVKFCSLLVITSWGLLAKVPKLVANYPEDKAMFAYFLSVIFIFFAHQIRSAAKRRLREKAPLLPQDSIHKPTVVSIAVMFALDIVIAVYYCFAPRPLFISPTILLMVVGLLLLVVLSLLENIMSFMVPFNRKLIAACFGLFMYFAVAAAYLHAKAYHAGRISSRNVSALDNLQLNRTMDTVTGDDFTILNLTETDHIEGDTDVTNHLVRVCLVTALIFFLLAVDFLWSSKEIDKRYVKTSACAAAASRKPAAAAHPVVAAAKREPESDYDSDEPRKAERRAMLCDV